MNDPRLALIVRAAAALLSFLLSLAIARLLGAPGFGEFSLVMAVVNVGVVIALLGNESLALRTLASAKSAGGVIGAAAVKYCRKSARNTWLTGTATALLGAGLVWAMVDLTELSPVALVLCLLIPLMARSRLTQSMLRGVHKSGLAMLPDGVARPLFSIVLVSTAAFAAPSHIRTAFPFLLALAALLAWSVGAAMEARWVGWSRYPGGTDLRAAVSVPAISFAMFASSLCAVLDAQLPVLMLGVVASAEDTGLFAAAERLAQPSALIAQTIYVAIAGRLAALYAKGDIDALRRLVRQSVRAVTLATMLLCLVIAFVAEPLLGLFGATYGAAKPVLWFLLAAAAIDAAAGPTGMILLMFGAEAQHMRAMLVALAFQLLALLVLPPILGLVGAGVAVLASKFVWNAVMLHFIWRRFDLGPLLIRA